MPMPEQQRLKPGQVLRVTLPLTQRQADELVPYVDLDLPMQIGGMPFGRWRLQRVSYYEDKTASVEFTRVVRRPRGR
jgi:hypothetical protein